MLTTHAVGIDLGTTFSCIAYLNERGEPITLPNHEGEQCTPSVVMYEDGEEVVGTEAWRSSIVAPGRVVQNAKRFMGDPHKRWAVDGRSLSPIDVSSAVLRKLLRDANEISAIKKVGPIERAVITVPAQFSDLQRQATVQAGLKAGLKQVDIINEPVAAALCYVLGKEGLWFTELAEEQKILVYDLGGGTFDLSLVRYQQDEVKVIASSGDLKLGGIDWNDVLLKAVGDQFTREFGEDPRQDPESHQALYVEVEGCKRSLSTRPRASLICQHAGKRKTYQIEQEQFHKLTEHLVKKTEEITKQMLKDNKMGWAHVNVVLTTGGSSRMPSIRGMLQKLSGRTLNTTLSPDQAIAHGAAYYAGMLISNNAFAKSILNEDAAARLQKVKQQSVNARALGVLVRDVATKTRVPHYMIPGNTPLPTSVMHTFGTVVPNQRRVVLRIAESGAGTDQPFVEIGDCAIDGLPENLPIDSPVAVTISYDASAKIHVSAKDVASGKEAQTQILRVENVLTQPTAPVPVKAEDEDDYLVVLAPAETMPIAKMELAQPAAPAPRPIVTPPPLPPAVVKSAAPTVVKPAASAPPKPAVPAPKPVPPPGRTAVASKLEESAVPIPLCNECGEPLNARGVCSACGPQKTVPVSKPAAPAAKPAAAPVRPAAAKPPATAKPAVAAQPTAAPAKRPVSATIPAVKPRPSPAPTPAPKAQTVESTQAMDLSKIFEPDDDEIFDLPKKPAKPAPKPATGAKPAPKPVRPAKPLDDDEDADFWRLPDK